MAKRKTFTSTEVKQRWEANNYSKYVVRIRYDTDQQLIDRIESLRNEGMQTSEVFRAALKTVFNLD